MALFEGGEWREALLTMTGGVAGKPLDTEVPIGREAACPSARQMARDEARHGKAFAGLLKRYF